MRNLFWAIILCPFLFVYSAIADEIITFYESFKSDILEKKAEYFQPTESDMREAQKIADKLMNFLKPRMPLPGISATQIGINKQIFLYSWDKSWKNLVIVINPQIVSSHTATIAAWEACESAIEAGGIVKVAYVRRPIEVEVQYVDINGNPQHKILEGFAARAFQHHYDHLNGINRLKEKGIKVRTFLSHAEFKAFIKKMMEKHKPVYYPPKNVEYIYD